MHYIGKLSIVSLFFFAIPAVHAQDGYFRGKTLRVIVGSSAGNTQDQMTRLVARYLPKYLPGHPNVIVENMSGASSLIAANYLYKIAKADGLTIATVSRALYFDQLVGRKEVQFDWAKYAWLGSPVEGHEVLFIAGNLPYKNLRDLISAGQPVNCGASGKTSTGFYIPKLVQRNLRREIPHRQWLQRRRRARSRRAARRDSVPRHQRIGLYRLRRFPRLAPKWIGAGTSSDRT